MIPALLIRRKRNGETLPPADIEAFFRAYADGDIADYHMAAFLMAVHFQGLDRVELSTLVDALWTRAGASTSAAPPVGGSTSTRPAAWATRSRWCWRPWWRRWGSRSR